MSRRLDFFLALLLLVLTLLVVIVVWKPKDQGYNPDLFGMHETLAFRSLHENLNISRAFEIMHSLGVKKIRMSFWRGSFMLNSTEINPNVTDAIEQVVRKADSLGMEIMGYAQDFPSWMRIVEGDSQTIPHRNTAEYATFLSQYEESWETLAREFPKITMWEIGNEYNLHQFLHPTNEDFGAQERVDIVTDLLYLGSRGIKKSNPEAITVMGGLGPGGNGIKDIENFLRSIYENIDSNKWNTTDPDDFFEIACWHPYIFKEKPTKQNWVAPNKAVYQVMKQHGDDDRHVFFSEMGYTDNDLSRDEIAEYLKDVFSLAKDNFPWLGTIYWYRLTDRDLIYQGLKVSKMDGFGVFESPETWTWKPAAYAYQSLTHLDDNAAGNSIPHTRLARATTKTVQKTEVEKVKPKRYRNTQV